ncbi:hypothetical protein B0H19DRAFT_1078768 [Mycena capillaripes]|nr:hypothetical protein B0H19DRAFT_1078768 [Mycena capillaripes]
MCYILNDGTACGGSSLERMRVPTGDRDDGRGSFPYRKKTFNSDFKLTRIVDGVALKAERAVVGGASKCVLVGGKMKDANLQDTTQGWRRLGWKQATLRGLSMNALEHRPSSNGIARDQRWRHFEHRPSGTEDQRPNFARVHGRVPATEMLSEFVF